MDDISTLQIRVLSADVATATNRLTALEKAAYGTERAAKGATSGLGGMVKNLALVATGYITAAGAARGFMAIIGSSRAYQVQTASLKTATGSLEAATKAYAQLEKIARETPFTQASVTDAYIRMINYGLTPSERAIRSYGDTAAATNKDVVSLVEGVADAVNGEFERVKEGFNVKAKNMGDTVVFRFRGTVTEVKNNAKEIEEYFIKLGEMNFMGGMDERMQTIDGAISNLGDSWNKLLITLGKSGIADAAEDGIRRLTVALDELSKYIESGALDSRIESWTADWGLMWADIAQGAEDTGNALAHFINEASRLMDDHNSDVEDTEQQWRSLEEFIRSLPAAVYMFTKIATAELQKFAHLVETTLTFLSKKFNLGFEKAGGNFNSWMQENFKNNGAAGYNGPQLPRGSFSGSSLYSETDPINGPKFPDMLGKTAGEAFNETVDSKWDSWLTEFDDRNNALAGIYKEGADKTWEDATNLYGQTISKQREAEARAAAQYEAFGVLPPKGDYDLSQHGVGGDGTTPPPSKKRSGSGSGGGRATDPLADLQRRLDREVEMTEDAYAQKLAIIDKYTLDGSKAEMDLSLTLLEEWEKDEQKRIDKAKTNQETMWVALEAENEMIRLAYDRRKEIILAATDITEKERARMLEAAQTDYLNKITANQAETNEKYMGAAKTFFKDLSSMGSAFGEKGFKIAKAAAIAEATVNTYSAAVNAYKSLSGIPYVGPVLGAAAAGAAIAAGMANIAQIKSQEYTAPSAGSFAVGGIVPGNSRAGDQMTAAVNSGEMILTGAQQRNLFRMANGSSPNSAPNVTIINNAGAQVTQQSQPRSDGGFDLRFYLEAAENHIAEQIERGGTRVARGIEGTYATPRGRKY